MLDKITFAIRNKESKKEKELIGLGVKKENIVSYNNIEDLMLRSIETDYVFTLDENSVLNVNFLDILSELDLKKDRVTASLINVQDDKGDIHFYNKTPLLMNSYSELVNYIEMTTLGVFIPKEILINEKFKPNELLTFYKDLNFYLFLLKEEIEVEIFAKKTMLLTTNEFDHNSYEKELLDEELKQIINGQE